MGCYLCKSDDYFKRPGTVRDNPQINILECSGCGLVYLSSFEHIQDKHYEESGMHVGEIPEINSWLQATELDDRRRYEFVKDIIFDKNILDFGCGVGGFLGIAKSIVKTASGIELESALQSSFLKRNLNVYPSLEVANKENKKYQIITAFHVIEHLKNPKKILKNLADLLDENGEIIIEVPNSDDALLTLYESKDFQNFTYWSQHLFLFNSKTLTELFKQAGLKINWLKHIQRYQLSNHLYWLSKGASCGQKYWQFLDNNRLALEYERQLASIGKTDTLIASVSVALKK